ncbi:MAG TPA: deaminase, partial [Herpetosiphonaceae bacterium]
GRIIGSAYTMERSEQRLLVHADFLALNAADQLRPFPGRRRDAKLFVTLEPCLMCLGAAMSFFAGEIYYGVESPGDGATSLIQHWQRKEQDFPNYCVPTIVGGVLRSESIALFQSYCRRYTSGAMAAWARTIAAL